MAQLSIEEQQYFDDLFEMFGTPGWKRFMREVEAEIYQKQADILEHANTWESVLLQRGQVSQLAYLLRLQEVTQMNLNELVKSREDELHSD